MNALGTEIAVRLLAAYPQAIAGPSAAIFTP